MMFDTLTDMFENLPLHNYKTKLLPIPYRTSCDVKTKYGVVAEHTGYCSGPFTIIITLSFGNWTFEQSPI